MPADPDPLVTAILPMPRYPHRIRTRRQQPTPSNPNPFPPMPFPATRNPHIARPRTWENFLHHRRGWRGRFGRGNRRRGRRWIDNLGRICGSVDHEINHPITDAGFFQIKNLRCAQVIDRARSANLTNYDFIADTGLCQCLDIGQPHGLGVARAMKRQQCQRHQTGPPASHVSFHRYLSFHRRYGQLVLV